MVDSTIDVQVVERLCNRCNDVLWYRDLEKRPHRLSIEELTKSTRCPLCRLLCSAMVGAKTVVEELDQSFVVAGWSQKFREAPKGSAITIDPLQFHPRLKQAPYRFLQPSAGGPGNRRQGSAVGVIFEETPYWEEVRNRAIWTQQASNLDEKLGTIRGWLAECSKSHETCESDSESELPKRVINVEWMVLYEPSEHEKGRYTALSYCWGRDSSGNDILTTKTTPKNLEDRKKSLWLEGEIKHKTFTDAIDITRGLGIRYLWIDALCIVQGDCGDFESEAGKMANCYGNVTVTLAATDSVDCEGGMLYPSNLRGKFSASRFRYWGRTGYAFLESIQTDLENEINSAPLNQRGWVLQERILSRRMVHFCKKQLIWECGRQVASEDGLVVLNKHRITRPFALSNPLSPAQDVYEDWDDIVQGYSGRLLSKAKDKLLALAGATTYFRRLLYYDHPGDAPLLGLWREYFHAGLLWRAREPGGRIDAVELELIPSWSWMGFDGPITFDTEHRRNFRYPSTTQMVMEVTYVNVRWEGRELTSRVTYATLQVFGRLIPFNSTSTTIEEIWWDFPSRTSENMFLLLVAQVQYRLGWNSEGNWIFGTKDFFLILTETSKMGPYSRVGMGAVDNGQETRGYFADMGSRSLLLV